MQKNKTISITGGTGHLGNYLIEKLIKNNFLVNALYFNKKSTINHPNLTWIKGDITKPDSLHLSNFLGTSILNWIFLILTLVKAYGIAWYFMHLKQEKAGLRRAIVWTAVFLISYLAILVLIEGNFLGDVLSGRYTKWFYR